MSKRKFKSDAFEAIHASAEALHRTGVIDKATMRDFDTNARFRNESAISTPTRPCPRIGVAFAHCHLATRVQRADSGPSAINTVVPPSS